jgi:hypothetical protein
MEMTRIYGVFKLRIIKTQKQNNKKIYFKIRPEKYPNKKKVYQNHF